MWSQLHECPGLQPGVVPAPASGPGRFSTSHGWVRVLQHPICVVLNSELFPYSTTSSHTRRDAARTPEARQWGARLALLRGETGRPRQCWEQSVEQGRAKAARQTQTMCSQQAELLSCPDGQTETIRLRRRDNQASSGKGKGCGMGEALPVLSCSYSETTDGLQWEQECTLNAQRGRIQLEAVMSAGLNTGLETRRGEVGALPSSACSWLCDLRQVTSPCASVPLHLLGRGRLCDRFVQQLARS